MRDQPETLFLGPMIVVGIFRSTEHSPFLEPRFHDKSRHCRGPLYPLRPVRLVSRSGHYTVLVFVNLHEHCGTWLT